MTKQETLEAIKVMQAWCDGRNIQSRLKLPYTQIGGSIRWLPVSESTEQMLWDFDVYEFRIPPKPIEIEAWVHNETGQILDTSMSVSPIGYTKRKFREVIE
jgi:hypothetical protein